MECKSNIFGGWKKYDERGGCFSRYSSGVKRKEEDDASRAPLPIHSATLFPRGSLRPKFIARGNAFIPSVTLPSASSSYFYRHRVYSLSFRHPQPRASTSSFLRFSPFRSRSDRGTITIPENIKCPVCLRFHHLEPPSLPPLPYWPFVAQLRGPSFLLEWR